MALAAPIPALNLVLTLEVEQLPIAGTVQQDSAESQRFDGWLELIAAIESALKAARGDPRPTKAGGRS
jgi:hypothetical protein